MIKDSSINKNHNNIKNNNIIQNFLNWIKLTYSL